MLRSHQRGIDHERGVRLMIDSCAARAVPVSARISRLMLAASIDPTLTGSRPKTRLTLAHAPRLILDGMADCCCAGPEQPSPAVACRVCGASGKPVEPLTVKALLTYAALARYEHAAYRFCSDMACAVVYFSETGTTFTKDDLRERVWQKEPSGRRTLCYCFGENEAEIADEIERTGQSSAVQRIRAHIVAKRCACEVRNPRGTCCLGDLLAAIEQLRHAKMARS